MDRPALAAAITCTRNPFDQNGAHKGNPISSGRTDDLHTTFIETRGTYGPLCVTRIPTRSGLWEEEKGLLSHSHFKCPFNPAAIMTQDYNQRIKLVWKIPADCVVPRNPDPCDHKLPAPPPGTHRHYLATPAGHLELLYALPSHATLGSPISNNWKPAALFLHGGFGSANCFSNFLPWFAARGHPAYSLSLRGHGRSWRPSYWTLYFTPKQAFADDVTPAINFINEHHPHAGPIALLGHSAGGGLIQYIVGQGEAKNIGKLGIIAGFPNFGGWQVYWNWFKLDPWFPIRLIRDLYHPRSVLSSIRLIHQAFFSPTYSVDKVRAFEAEMAPYESMSWPSQMLTKFVSSDRVLSQLYPITQKLEGPGQGGKRAPLLVVAGAQDVLMTPPIMRRLAQLYAVTNVGVGIKTTLGLRDVSKLQHEFTSGVSEEGDRGENEGDIWYAEIAGPGAGHNLMTDDGWEKCARVVQAFLDK